jgi:hypothetical protein
MANLDLSALSSEAASLVDRAKQLRAKMDALPAGDPQIIRDLLKSANSISEVVKSSVPST